MNISEHNKDTKIQNESAKNDTIKKEYPHCAIDMELVEKETVTPGAITLAKSKDYICVDMIENKTEPPTDKIAETESGSIEKITELRVHIIGSPKPKEKFSSSLKGIYDNMVRLGKPPETLRQEQLVRPPQQTIVAQYNSPQNQGPLQAQGYPKGPIEAQGYPQNPTYPGQAPYGQGYPSSPGYGQGFSFPGFGQGYPQQPGGGYPQQQGYGQQHTYPGQGYPNLTGPPLEYNPETRNSFVRLVMILVLIMLIVTAVFTYIVYTTPDLRQFFKISGWTILIPAMVLLIAAQCCLMASPCARAPPGNFICLFLAVAAMSIITARVTAFYRTEIIMYALVATTIVVMICILLSFSKFDFTSYMLYIVGIATAFSVIVLIILIVTMISGTMMKPLFIGILIVGTIIQVVMELRGNERVGVFEIIDNYHAHIELDAD